MFSDAGAPRSEKRRLIYSVPVDLIERRGQAREIDLQIRRVPGHPANSCHESPFPSLVPSMPRRQRRSPCFVGVDEHVAAGGKLRQHDHIGARPDRVTNLRLDQRGVGGEIADRGIYLATRDPDHGRKPTGTARYPSRTICPC